MDLRGMFSRNLIRLRRAKGFTQEDLANEADIDRAYISRLEAGRRYAGLEIIGKLAEALEVDPAEFLKVPPRKVRRSS